MTRSGSGQLIKHSGLYGIGNLSRQLVGFLMLPIYTRHLDPADYGVVGLLLFSVSLVELFFGARLAQAIPKFYFEKDSGVSGEVVVSTALFVTTAASILTAGAVMLSAGPISEVLFATAEYELVVILFSTMIVTNAIEYYGLTYLRLRREPILFVAISLSKMTVQLVLNVTFVIVLELGILGVAIGNVVASLIFATGLGGYTLWHTGSGLDRRIAERMLRFSWPLWLAGFANLYINASSRYFIRVFGSLDEVGLYELASRLTMVLIALVWQPFNFYWQTERFRIYSEPGRTSIFGSVFGGVHGLLIAGALGISLFAGPVIELMAATPFHAASLAVPWLLLGETFGCTTIYLNFSLLAHEKTAWINGNSYATAVIVTVFYLALIPWLGFVGAAQAVAAAKAVQAFLVFRAARLHFDMEIRVLDVAYRLGVGVVAYVVATQWISVEGWWADQLVRLGIFTVAAVALFLQLLNDPRYRSLTSESYVWIRRRLLMQ